MNENIDNIILIIIIINVKSLLKVFINAQNKISKKKKGGSR